MKRGLRLLVGMSFIVQTACSMDFAASQLDPDGIALVEELSSMSLTEGGTSSEFSRTPTPGGIEAIFELKGRSSAQLRRSPAAASPTKFGMRVKPATCIEEAFHQLREKLSLNEMFLKIVPINEGLLASFHIFLNPKYYRQSAMNFLVKEYGDLDFIAREIQDKVLKTHLQTVVTALLACLKKYTVGGATLTVWKVEGMPSIVFPEDTAVECELRN